MEDHEYAQDGPQHEVIRKMINERRDPVVCLKRLIQPYKFKTENAIATHFNKSEFSDLLVLSGEQSFYVHRLVLAINSEVFNHLLCGQWAERGQKELRLMEHEICQPHVANFLEYFYTGSIWLSSKTVLAFFVLADKYDVVSLREECVRYLLDALKVVPKDGKPLPNETLDIDCINHLLTTWSACCPEITAAARYNLACRLSHAQKLPNDAFISSLPNEILLQMVQYDHLPSIDEYKLWKTVIKVIQSPQIEKDCANELLCSIRYGLLTKEQLYEVERHHSTMQNYTVREMVYSATAKLAFCHINPDDPRFTGVIYMPRTPLL